jgi:hypothetical protein
MGEPKINAEEAVQPSKSQSVLTIIEAMQV